MPLAVETGGRISKRGEEALLRLAALASDPMGDAASDAASKGAATRRLRETLAAMKRRLSVALWRGNGRCVAQMLRALAERPVKDEAAALVLQQQAAVEAGVEALEMFGEGDDGDF